MVVSNGVDGVEKQVDLTEDQVNQFFQDASKFKLWSLPSTDYEVDNTDDLYHMGISIDAQAKDGQTFYHKSPTGVFVMVPTRRATNKEKICFAAFVHSVTAKVHQLSGINVPKFLLDKWMARVAR